MAESEFISIEGYDPAFYKQSRSVADDRSPTSTEDIEYGKETNMTAPGTPFPAPAPLPPAGPPTPGGEPDNL